MCPNNKFEDSFDDADVLEFNTEDRMALLILIDTSRSMFKNGAIYEVIAGLNILKDSLKRDVVASRRVEILLMTYGSQIQHKPSYVLVHDLEIPLNTKKASDLDEFFKPGGKTPMGEAICKAIEQVNLRKEQYKKQGISYYKPWIVNLTDGGPTDRQTEFWKKAKAYLRQQASKNGLVFFNLGTEQAQSSALLELHEAGARRPGMIKNQQFTRFFQWLSGSMQQVSRSQIGVQVELEKMSDDFFAPI